MCNGCRDIFIKFKKVIRGAALTYANSFVEADDLIGIINLKFFSWKKNQEGNLNLRNAFFYKIAKNAAIDQIDEEDNELHNDHTDLIQNVFFGDSLNNVEKKYLVDQILMKVSPRERDALLSVANKEAIEEYKTRNDIERTNSAFQNFSKNNKILEITQEKLVSVDFNHNPASSIVDASLTNTIGKNMGKISAWYDNEWGFSNRMCDLAEYLHKIS